ncbi:MAG: alcohol dehydrogenase catalytic domain-containing protein [Opitutaceae bacterium]|nr:alcohol dehydrogenase catalytic domain-containing protein [Opitutaceae bacterium]
MEKPHASGKDILVKVEAISVNPVDAKVRQRMDPPEGGHIILGWEATGIIEEVGGDVQLFKKGDKVWYAGALERSGANAEYNVVDERVVSRMPETLSFADAAALPLTSLTASEILFDRFRIDSETCGTLQKGKGFRLE